jgi:hypothetical protein
MNNIAKLLLTSTFVLMIGCSDKSDNNANNKSIENKSSTLIIDNASVVPVIGVNQATTTSIFVHNEGDNPISGISYSSTNVKEESSKTSQLIRSTSKAVSSGVIIDSTSANNCSTIPAHGKCTLTFTTPSFATLGNQGYSTITAKYKVNNEIKTFNQIINYQQIEPEDGIHITSGLNLTSFGYKNSYGTLFLYSGNQTNKVKSLKLNKPAFSIIDNNITGNELSPLQVQAVEVMAPANIEYAMVAQLSVTTINNLTSSANVTAIPSNSGAILISGMLPNYDLNGQNTNLQTISYTVTNVGNESAILGAITFSTTKIITKTGTNQCTSTTVLAIGSSCNVYLNIDNNSESAGGSGLATVNYSSASITPTSISTSINWINSQSGGLSGITYTNPITLVQNSGGFGLNESFTFTITQYIATLNNVQINVRKVNDGGNAVIISNTTCSTIPSTCVVTVRLSDSVIENSKQILITLTGTVNGNSYTRNALVTYNTVTNRPLFILQPTPSSYNLTADGVESQTGTILVSNNGATASSSGKITLSSITQSKAFFTVTYGPKCESGTLAIGESCLVYLKLGPRTESASYVGESGIATYTVGVLGINLNESSTATTSINYNIQSYAQGFNITNITLAAADSGSGTLASPYIIGGEKVAPKLIVTYQNIGLRAMKVMGAYESTTSRIFWRRESFSPIIVNPNESFTITYTNVLGSTPANYLINTLVSPAENITLPTLYFLNANNASERFQQDVDNNGSMIVYVTGQLGTINNTINITNPSLFVESYTITSTLTTTRAYTDISLNALSDISGNKVFSITSNCTSNESGSITNLNCMLNQTNNTGSAIYTVNPLFISESIPINIYYNAPGYNMNSNNQAFVLNTINLGSNLSSLMTITPKNPTLNLGTTQQFTATVNQNGTTVDVTNSVTWSSSNTAVATINSSGLATGVSDGSTIITATSGSVSANTSFTFIGNLYASGYSTIVNVALNSAGAKTNEISNNINYQTITPRPGSIAVYNGYMYIVSQDSPYNIIICSWNPLGSVNSCYYSNINASYSFSPLEISNGYLYYLGFSPTYGYIVKYSKINADGSLSTNSKDVVNTVSYSKYKFYKNYVYYQYSNSYIYYCQFTNESTFSNCQNSGLTAMGIIKSFKIYNGYLYIFDYSIIKSCPINSDGSITNSNCSSTSAPNSSDFIIKKNKYYFSDGSGYISSCSIDSNRLPYLCSDFALSNLVYNLY